MSKIKLLNNQGDEVTIEHSNTSSKQGNSIVNIKDVTKQVDTIADLKALDGSHKLVYVTGYHTKGDGAFGSHFFEWDATSTEVDNGGTIIALTSVATGRYKLKYSGSVNVKWFGAKGDGVTDDTKAIQKTIGGYSNKNTIYIPSGDYLITSTINTGTYKNIIGEDQNNTTLLFNSLDSFLFEFDAFTNIKNLKLKNITGTGEKTAIASYTPTTSSGMNNSILDTIIIEDFYYGIGSDQGLTRAMIYNSIFKKVKVYNAHKGLLIGAGSNANTFINCEFWNNYIPIHLNNNTTVNFIECTFENSGLLDFLIEVSYNINFETCYFEPAKGGRYDDSSGKFTNCHSTKFATNNTIFLSAINNSICSIIDFIDYDYGNTSTNTQSYFYIDASSYVYAVNINKRPTSSGVEKHKPLDVDGHIIHMAANGDSIVTKFGNGLMIIDINTKIYTKTLIMTGSGTSYSNVYTLPISFMDENFIAQASIFANAAYKNALVCNPKITCQPISPNQVGITAMRDNCTNYIDGYFFTIRCVGRWK